MRYIIILFLLTNCTSNYPTVGEVYIKHRDFMSGCERSYNKACQLHGEE